MRTQELEPPSPKGEGFLLHRSPNGVAPQAFNVRLFRPRRSFGYHDGSKYSKIAKFIQALKGLVFFRQTDKCIDWENLPDAAFLLLFSQRRDPGKSFRPPKVHGETFQRK